MITNANILITGATGSLGKSFIEFLLTSNEHRPNLIKILSRDEDKQYWLHSKYKNTEYSNRLQFIIGDIRSQPTVVSALQNTDIVIHAAAMKQVPICEEHPYEAVQTNIIGSHNIVSAIHQYKIPVKKVIGISTDKACEPINVYGMTKFIQEKIFILANVPGVSTDFILARYGNVLGSRGSVLQVFNDQIRSGGPITITDPKMTRFFFSIDDAIQTVICAINEAKRGEIFIPKIKSFSIMNVAKIMQSDSGIPISIVGIRAGEKLHETLIAKNDISRTYCKNIDGKNYYVIKPYFDKSSHKQCIKEYISKYNVNSLEETRTLLKKNGFI